MAEHYARAPLHEPDTFHQVDCECDGLDINNMDWERDSLDINKTSTAQLHLLQDTRWREAETLYLKENL